jgi:SOS-response transcriptional repressor LexA
MALGQIIRQKREQLGLTLEQVSRQVGFSKPYLSTVETGRVRNPPSDRLLAALEKALDFEPGLLRHIAHVERLPQDIRRQYEAAEAENEKWRQLIRTLVRRRTDTGELLGLLEQSEAEMQPLRSAGAARLVPVINRVSAGYPADFNDLDYPAGVADDYVRCPDVHDPQAFAVRVVGDSMAPRFCEGDIVVFSPAAQVRNGDDCFVRFAEPHECIFKRVFFEEHDKLRLQPRNESYPPQIVDAERVNGVYRAVIKYERL